MGRNRGCIIVDYLYYFDVIDGFPVPVVHALLHNVFGAFLTFALRPLSDAAGAAAGTIISREGRAKIAAQGAHIIPTATIGRGYKSVIKHLGLYTFEDYKNLALTYGTYLFRNALPPLLHSMYNNLTKAIRHHLTFDSEFTPSARTAARPLRTPATARTQKTTSIARA